MNNYFYMVVCECIDNGDIWADGIFPKFKHAQKRIGELKKLYEPENFSMYIIVRPFGVIDWSIIEDKIDDNELTDYNEL